MQVINEKIRFVLKKKSNIHLPLLPTVTNSQIYLRTFYRPLAIKPVLNAVQ